jgi:hypothetical protein
MNEDVWATAESALKDSFVHHNQDLFIYTGFVIEETKPKQWSEKEEEKIIYLLEGSFVI